MRSSEFTVLPLAHDRAPRGHMAIITSMHTGTGQNVTEERRRLGGNGRSFAAEHCTNSSVASVLDEYVTPRIQQ